MSGRVLDTTIRTSVNDKKTVAGRIHFVLLRGIGSPFVDGTVHEDAVLAVLDHVCTPARQTP